MNVSGKMALKMLARGIRNKYQQRPLSVSFEITHYCTANCWHCNWGGPFKGETRLNAEEYAAICRELSPAVSHISGGEPLARSDVYDIVRAMANPGDLPWMILVSNFAAMNPDKYEKLRDCGINQFSFSLDFPDDRHSEFRRIPNLFQKMDRVVPQLTARGHGDVSINACITAWNYKSVPDMVKLMKKWRTPINFSVYTPLRISDDQGLPSQDQEKEVREVFQKLIDMKKEGYPIYTSERIMWKFYKFFIGERFQGCEAGRRFLVINPDGRFTPCAMVMAYHDDQRSMLNQFFKNNTCDQCYISTRANTEKTLKDFVVDNWDMLTRQVLPWKKPRAIEFDENGAESPLEAGELVTSDK